MTPFPRPRDPLGFVDGPNVYTYVVQNPWTYFDPLGLKKEDEEPEDDVQTAPPPTPKDDSVDKVSEKRKITLVQGENGNAKVVEGSLEGQPSVPGYAEAQKKEREEKYDDQAYLRKPTGESAKTQNEDKESDGATTKEELFGGKGPIEEKYGSNEAFLGEVAKEAGTQAVEIGLATIPVSKLIPAKLTRSKSYSSELAGETVESLQQMSKGKGQEAQKAKKMLKLVKETSRLSDKLRNK